MELITNKESCLALLVIACTSFALSALLLSFTKSSKSKPNCPPGPRNLPIISTMLWLIKSTLEIESAVRLLCSKYGQIITIHIASYPIIFISSGKLAHQALIQNGTVFADRPKPLLTAKILNNYHFNVSLACYGPTWRILRRNMTSHIFQPSRSKNFSQARKWALDMLLKHLRLTEGSVVRVMDHFRFAMFSLLVFMCFGDRLNESQISEIDTLQRQLLSSFNRFFVLDFCWHSVTKILFHNRWNELYNLKKKREELLLPYIKAHKKRADQRSHKEQDEPNHHGSTKLFTSYVDTLLTLELPEDGSSTTAAKRNLTEEELVILCSEFLSAGTDTTSTALQWIMANLVKYPRIQVKLFEEIKGVIGEEAAEVGEDELSKMPYLKAVVLEGLRRHPPSHFVLPHAVTQEVELGGYTVHKNAIVNLMVAEMGMDPAVWKNPTRFEPERFLPVQGTEEFDITGSREIKMMPFGAGRRMCPGFGLAMLHLEYFVASLVWKFEWTAVEGDEIDLSEKQEFSIVMKHPLHACISPRQTI